MNTEKDNMGFDVSGRNYGLVPLPGQATDKETQLARLHDFMIADRDKEAAIRARDYYGETLPIDNIADEDKAYFVGAAYARINGVPNHPEAYWLGQNKELPDADRETLYEQMGKELKQEVDTSWNEQQAKLEERKAALTGLFGDIVSSGGQRATELWSKFYEGQAREVFTAEDEVSIRKAADAWGMMSGMVKEYADAGANVLTNASTGQLIMERLRGDELAEALFFNKLQSHIADMKTSAEERNFFVRFGQAFEAADKQFTAGMLGGHFKAFVTDEQVDDYNAERARLQEKLGLENPNVELLAEGDNWAEKYLPIGNARLGAVHAAARASGQLNADGSLRKMTEEERRSTQELGEFRGKLYNAVHGLYDIEGVAAKFGNLRSGQAEEEHVPVAQTLVHLHIRAEYG